MEMILFYNSERTLANLSRKYTFIVKTCQQIVMNKF